MEEQFKLAQFRLRYNLTFGKVVHQFGIKRGIEIYRKTSALYWKKRYNGEIQCNYFHGHNPKLHAIPINAEVIVERVIRIACRMEPSITLRELCQVVDNLCGLTVSIPTLSRFMKSIGMSFKK
jgi:transposase